MAKGPITLMVENRTIKDILKSDYFIVIRYVDGTSHTIEWIDDNGTPLKGSPRLKYEGWHIMAKPRHFPKVYRERESGVLIPKTKN